MNRDAKFINFSEVHELDYILKKYGKEPSKENRDLLKEFGKKAKEFLGKTMLGHEEFYKYLDDNSLIKFSPLGSKPFLQSVLNICPATT